MTAELDGEVRAVTRHRRGVLWCPFCDRSRQDEGISQFCEGCTARFVDEVPEAIGEVAPRRRGRAAQVAETDPDPQTDEAPE